MDGINKCQSEPEIEPGRVNSSETQPEEEPEPANVSRSSYQGLDTEPVFISAHVDKNGCEKNLQDIPMVSNQRISVRTPGYRLKQDDMTDWLRASNNEMDSIQVRVYSLYIHYI